MCIVNLRNFADNELFLLQFFGPPVRDCLIFRPSRMCQPPYRAAAGVKPPNCPLCPRMRWLPHFANTSLRQTRRCILCADEVNNLHVDVTATGSNVTATPPSCAADCDIRVQPALTGKQPVRVFLRCVARGNPAPEFTWSGPLEPYSATQLAGLRMDSNDASLLHIENFTRSGTLAVLCEARNTIQLDKPNKQTLTVRVSFEGFATFSISYLILLL